MKTLLTTLCLSIAVLLGSVGVSWSADYQKGLDAAKSGDYATALREWTPLAEQGDANAQGKPGTSRPTKSMNSPCCTPKRKCTSIWIKAGLTANSAGLAELPASC